MNRRWEKWCAFFFCCAGVGLLALAGYIYFAPDPAPVVEAQTHLEFPDWVAGQKRDVVLQVYNKSNLPVRVLGITLC